MNHPFTYNQLQVILKLLKDDYVLHPERLILAVEKELKRLNKEDNFDEES